MGLQVWPNRMSDLAVQYVPRELKRVDTPALDGKQGKILNRRTNMVTIPIWIDQFIWPTLFLNLKDSHTNMCHTGAYLKA